MAPRRVLFDVTRLFQRTGHASPTGIDRVILAYARWLLDQDHLTVLPVAAIGGHLAGVDRGVFLDHVQRSDRPDPAGDEPWGRLLAGLRLDSTPTAGLRPNVDARAVANRAAFNLLTSLFLRGQVRLPPAGDLYLNVSHSGLEQPDLLARAVKRGLAPVVMLHDLIPITHPEFCAVGAGRRHELRVRTTLRHAALILANSTATADGLASYAAAEGLATPPAIAAPLGIEAAFGEAPPLFGPPLHPYFVCVGTIEARKNLAFLLTLWRRVVEHMGDAAPHLVLVGRRGWENEAVIDHLERSSAVAVRVHEIADLSDARLAALVGGARALLAPSLAEGFDLPVMEALALGAPVIASDIPVHRELAVGATLIDPLDGPGWLAAIETATRASPRRNPPVQRRWEDHFALVGPALALATGHG